MAVATNYETSVPDDIVELRMLFEVKAATYLGLTRGGSCFGIFTSSVASRQSKISLW
jgi:hypothetical protein